MPNEQARKIIIPVDVPQTQVVHTAHLRLLNSVYNGRSQPSTIGVGHSVPAELILKYSRKWDTQGKVSNAEPEVLEFYYELGTNPDTWLIGGHRRAQYVAKVSKYNSKAHTRLTLLGTRDSYISSAPHSTKGGASHVSKHRDQGCSRC